MRLGLLANFQEMLAVFYEFAAHDAVDEHDIAIGIVSANLTLALPQKAFITYPIGDMMC